MNFDRDDKKFNYYEDQQDFRMPARGEYFASNLEQPQKTEISNFEQAEVQEVNPYEAPEYHPIETEKNSEEVFEEQEIANWQAQDMVIGEKDSVWYAIFGVVVLLAILGSVLIQNYSFAVLILVSGIAIVVTRQTSHARMISYSLSTRGVYIENKFHPYEEFRSFGILREKNTYSIVFVPKKRFAPATSIFFPKDEGEKITDIIGQRLPMEQIHHDIIDRIIRKIKL